MVQLVAGDTFVIMVSALPRRSEQAGWTTAIYAEAQFAARVEGGSGLRGQQPDFTVPQ